MKTLFGMVAVAGLLLAGPTVAADYQGTASYVGSVWNVAWPVNVTSCDAEVLAQLVTPISMTIDGAPYSASIFYLSYGLPSVVGFQPGPPDGVLTAITVGGVDHLTCGADRLLLTPVAAPTPVPTLSEWAMILLGVLLAGGAALTIQRRRASVKT